jgi:hypothetical protein
MKRKVGEAAVAITLACIAACGGKVVIDEGEQGAGGAGSSASSAASSGTGVLCSWPDPIGPVKFCAGTTGSGPGSECSEVHCDVNGNTYESKCQGAVCQCQYNTQTFCTCAQNLGGDICAGTAKPCCPIPQQPD